MVPSWLTQILVFLPHFLLGYSFPVLQTFLFFWFYLTDRFMLVCCCCVDLSKTWLQCDVRLSEPGEWLHLPNSMILTRLSSGPDLATSAAHMPVSLHAFSRTLCLKWPVDQPCLILQEPCLPSLLSQPLWSGQRLQEDMMLFFESVSFLIQIL